MVGSPERSSDGSRELRLLTVQEDQRLYGVQQGEGRSLLPKMTAGSLAEVGGAVRGKEGAVLVVRSKREQIEAEAEAAAMRLSFME
jgi:hypothetical protein